MALLFLSVDLNCEINNALHHTSGFTTEELVVRRGQSFLMKLELPGPFDPQADQLRFVAKTGSRAAEELGTSSPFGIPESHVTRSPKAKAKWRAELHKDSSPVLGKVTLEVTPPADAPVGKYFLSMEKEDKETSLGTLVVLYNPWCTEDWVHLPDEDERQEYVMNEQGVIYKGTDKYIASMAWDYGQFDEDMLEICLKLLDVNPKHLKDEADDVSARCNCIYVGRVVSAMINSRGDLGVLVGNWGRHDNRGVPPSHWNGSVDILRQWRKFGCHAVKYGQCWVFAGVMCSVMRCLGIPCRVVTNYQSAHDTDKSLSIDIYHSDYGVRPKKSPDSIWNFHVWVEAWMRRPDLDAAGNYDGWQVLDPTPQELSKGVYCCGPTSVKAILEGRTDLKYDAPFVYAEVNADVIDWMIFARGPKQQLFSDTTRVGHNISTKSVGSNKRMNITATYKHREGSEKERTNYKHALTRDYSMDGHVPHNITVELESIEEVLLEDNAGLSGGGPDPPSLPAPPPPQQLVMEIKEVSVPISGQDIQLKLTVSSKDKEPRALSLLITAQTMLYNGIPSADILARTEDHNLQPGQALAVAVVIPFSSYREHLVDCDSVNVSVVATDVNNETLRYLTECNLMLQDPPIVISVKGAALLYRQLDVDVAFSNPLQETLKDCTFTVTGSGLLHNTVEQSLPDQQPNRRVRLILSFTPYRMGQHSLAVDFDCHIFKNVKASVVIDVQRH